MDRLQQAVKGKTRQEGVEGNTGVRNVQTGGAHGVAEISVRVLEI